MIIPAEVLIPLFLGLTIITILAIPTIYIMWNWYEIRLTMKSNCLIWRHPDNQEDSQTKLDLIKWPEAPGGFWRYKAFIFMPEKPMKWCWEVKKIKEGGEVEYKIEPYIPDEHINYTGKTTGELADAIDWRPAKRLLQQKSPMLQKFAQGGMVLMGCAALFGIMVLLDMLEKGG